MLYFRRWRAAAIALSVGVATLLSSGCVSTSVPTSIYHTLDMRPSDDAAPGITLDRVRIRSGEAVARREIMIRTSPTEIEYYATHRWASDAGEQVREKLKGEFDQEATPGGVTVNIDAELLAFEQVDVPDGAQARVKLDAEISIVSAGGNRSQAFDRFYEVSIPADSAKPNAVVEALSRCVEDIAAALKTDVTRGVSR